MQLAMSCKSKSDHLVFNTYCEERSAICVRIQNISFEKLQMKERSSNLLPNFAAACISLLLNTPEDVPPFIPQHCS